VKPEQNQGKDEDTNEIACKSMFAFKHAVGKSSFGIVWKVTKKSSN